MLKKMIVIAVALLACIGLFGQEEKAKTRLAQGAACYAWNENTFVKPKTLPVGGFVDMATEFKGENVKVCEELRNLNRFNFIMWEGFLKVPKDETYRFTLIHTALEANVKVFLDSSALVTRRNKDPQTMTATASLKKGFCKIRIYMNCTGPDYIGFYGTAFQLKYAPGSAMKMTDITPATLYHQSEDEE